MMMTLGRGATMSFSRGQKLNVKSSTECELTQHKNARSVGYIVNNSMAITLKLLVTDKYETSGACLHMLVNIPVTFYDWFIYFLRYATHENLGQTCSVGYIVNNSRAITLHLLGTDKYET